MPSALILDTYYPAFLDSVRGRWRGASYFAHLSGLMDDLFGTADFWSGGLARHGWAAEDVIANAGALQSTWRAERGVGDRSGPETVLAQIDHLRPDVVILQDASFLPPSALDAIRARGILLVAQISCPMPPADRVGRLDVVFTSFPHYVHRLRGMGVRRAEYLPLAFEPSIPARMGRTDARVRDLAVTFVGGVGADLHWRRGTETLEAVARAFPQEFRWWGYGVERLAADSPLRACHRGEAWGRQMYDVYMRSRIVVNRHGEVAEGHANCMRIYEATGCGAALVTEAAPNLRDLFPADAVATYASPEDAVETVARLLEYEPARLMIANSGHLHTVTHHTFAARMARVAEALSQEIRR